jgi:hypothetical protein
VAGGGWVIGSAGGRERVLETIAVRSTGDTGSEDDRENHTLDRSPSSRNAKRPAQCSGALIHLVGVGRVELLTSRTKPETGTL